MGEYIIDNGKYLHARNSLLKDKLSAHALIAPNGDYYRCREDDKIAWHARGFNTNSLGVEFLVKGRHDYGSFIDIIKSDYITDKQLETGINVVANWMNLHDIKNIDRHSDVSPGRKVDPGEGFPWNHFIRSLEDV